MESLQSKIEELDKWRNIEKNVPSILPVIKTYGISLHTLDTSECQELASSFEEKARQNISKMMDLYKKSIMSRDTFSGMRSTLEMNIRFLFPFSICSKTNMKSSR